MKTLKEIQDMGKDGVFDSHLTKGGNVYVPAKIGGAEVNCTPTPAELVFTLTPQARKYRRYVFLSANAAIVSNEIFGRQGPSTVALEFKASRDIYGATYYIAKLARPVKETIE